MNNKYKQSSFNFRKFKRHMDNNSGNKQHQGN